MYITPEDIFSFCSALMCVCVCVYFFARNLHNFPNEWYIYMNIEHLQSFVNKCKVFTCPLYKSMF